MAVVMHVSYVCLVNMATAHGCVMPMVMRAGEGGMVCRLGRNCASEEECSMT